MTTTLKPPAKVECPECGGYGYHIHDVDENGNVLACYRCGTAGYVEPDDAPNTTVDCALCTGRGLPTHDRCDRPCPLCGGTGSYRVYVPPPGTPYSPKTTHHDAFFEED